MSPSTPKPPPPPPPPPPVPTIDMARERQIEADALSRRRGRASTIMTSQAGDLSQPSLAVKLLGQ